MHAYPECFLSPAKEHLAVAFDYAVEDCGLSGEVFAGMLAASEVGESFALGRPWALCGMSGEELAQAVIKEKMRPAPEFLPASFSEGRSVAYWVGWSLAVYQWQTARSFADIFRATPYDDLASMYKVYHEQDVSAFVRDLEARRQMRCPDTNLKRLREQCGLSQSQLAKRAGVGLRSIQMYEQRNNDIDKAQGATLARIARVLGCSIEDLLENPYGGRFEYCLVELQ